MKILYWIGWLLLILGTAITLLSIGFVCRMAWDRDRS